MKGRSLILAVLALSAAAAIGQSRTVTNADLERYRDQRVAAERDLNENYARLGFPSPAERARREAEAAKQREKLILTIRAEEMERARLDAQLTAAEMLANSARRQRELDLENTSESSETFPYFGGFPGYFNYNQRPRRRDRQWQYEQPGYYAGGMFIPTGPRTPPQPLIRVAPRR